MGCKKAQGFLERLTAPVSQLVDAGKTRMGREEALAFARRHASQVVTGRGEKITVVEINKRQPTDDALAELLLGPTGNLRAPTLLLGRTLIVGFNEHIYRQYLGTDAPARHR